jgi:hypothetical protein
MTARKEIRISDPLIPKIELDIKQRGIASENDWYIAAIEHFLSCKKLEHAEGMKLLVLRYPAVCLKCNKPIEAGQWGLYGRGVGVICIDCYIEKLGDKAVIAKHMKMRELTQINKALTAENERLADRLEILTYADKLTQLHEMTKEQRDLIFQYIKEPFPTDTEKQRFEEIMQHAEKQDALVRDLEQQLQKHMRYKKKPFQIPTEESST